MEGGDITVVAEPAEGYRFVRWERWLYNGAMIASNWEEVSNEASYTTEALGLSFDGAMQNIFRAVFEQDKGSFDISVTVKGIDPELVEITGAGTYTEGDNATLSFKLKDDTHYSFVDWRYDNKVIDKPVLVIEGVDANYEVTLTFKPNTFTVTATVIPAGAGVVKGQGEYDYGTDYTLTLEPAEGWVLKEWRDGIALDEKSNTLTGTVYGAINIEVELVQNIVTYTVTFLDWDATVLFVEKVEEGKDAKGPAVTPTREGYKFIGWSKPITNITADLLVIAQYEKIPQGFEDVQGNNVQCTKIVRDGQIYILRGDKVYNAQGALVK
jgi:hypothetical protein